MLSGGDRLTFREWDRRSDVVARAVRERGLRPGKPVGLVFDGSGWIDYAVAYCGVQKAGAVAVPLGAHLGLPAVTELLARCGVVGTIYSRTGPVPESPGWTVGVSEFDTGDDTPVEMSVRPGDAAQILYTSGTTGQPKGVLASHANLTYGLAPMARYRLLAHSEYCLHAFALGSNAAQTMLVNALVARRGVRSAHRAAPRRQRLRRAGDGYRAGQPADR